MTPSEIAVQRPQRWDIPFGDSMSDADVDRLLTNEPFCSIDPTKFPAAVPLRGILRNDCRINQYQEGEIVVREGDYGNSAFLVLQGKARVVLEGLNPEALGRPRAERRGVWHSLLRLWQNPSLPEVRDRLRASSELTDLRDDSQSDLSQTRVFLQDVPRVLLGNRSVSLHVGEIFGELAALTRSPRSATVLAEGSTVLLEIRWQGLRDLMRRTEALRLHVERLYRENSLRVHLRETPLLSQLPAEQLQAVAAATTFQSHGDFEWHNQFESARKSEAGAISGEPLIVEEGTPSSGLVLIRSGFARLSHRFGHGHRTLAYLGKGQIYGLAEAVETAQMGQPAAMASSLRALGYVDILHIPQKALEEHVFPHIDPAALQKLAAEHAVACNTSHCHPPAGSLGQAQEQVAPPLLEFLVEQRLINGSEAMVIDLDRCTRCDDCVRACAATHDNNPRFLRQGQRHGSYMIAHACMHCVDPVCMIGCPTGAIGREATSGCVRINDLTCIGCSTCANSCPYNNIRMAEVRDRQGAIVLDDATQQPIHKATKCDLCTDLEGGPACQRACPHDALVRMDLGNLGELSAWVNR